MTGGEKKIHDRVVMPKSLLMSVNSSSIPVFIHLYLCL